MKLYEVCVYTLASRLVQLTYYRTSLVEAKRLARNAGNEDGWYATVARVEVRTNLVAEDWIKLLEGDAPGSQDIDLTPVGLIEDRAPYTYYGDAPAHVVEWITKAEKP